jgi:hypothetical protein
MLRRIWITVAVAILITGGMLVVASGTAAGQGGAFQCNEATLRGTYGGQMQGTAPVPPPFPPGVQTVVGVVLRTYDGAGNFTQIDNIKGTISGIVPDRPGSGTYQVNADCTAVAVFQPGPGITIEERMVIVDDGGEIRSIASSPLAVMVSSVQKRIDRR